MLMTASEVTELSAQRVDARARLAVRRIEGRSRIERLYQEGAAKIRMPEVRGDPLEAILINTAGGLTGGDRIAWEIEAAERASVTVTTQACEKLYRSRSGEARADVRLKVGGWRPHRLAAAGDHRSMTARRFSRRLDVELAEGAEALIVEAVLFGRLAMGETVSRGPVSRPLERQARRQADPRRGIRNRARPRRDAGAPGGGEGRDRVRHRAAGVAGCRDAAAACARRSSARRAAQASGRSPELASFLRGLSPGTATACASAGASGGAAQWKGRPAEDLVTVGLGQA